MNTILNNRKILVAGAGGFLGSSVAKHLSENGFSVVCADINLDYMTERLKQNGVISSSNVELIDLDVNNEVMVKAFFNQVKNLGGAINCTYPRNKQYGAHFFDVSLSSFNENLNLHLGSSFLFMQQCAEYFKVHQQSFSLVNVSSIYGVVPPKFDVYEGTEMTMPVEYAAIKSALIHLSKYVVNYVGNSKFRVNCVSPGGLKDGQPDSFLEKYKNHTLGAGMLEVTDMCGVVEFLMSDSARFINGQNIVVDDGFTL